MEDFGTALEVNQNDSAVWLEAERFYNGDCSRCRLPFYQGVQVGVTLRDDSAPQMWATVCNLCWDNLQATA